MHLQPRQITTTPQLGLGFTTNCFLSKSTLPFFLPKETNYSLLKLPILSQNSYLNIHLDKYQLTRLSRPELYIFSILRFIKNFGEFSIKKQNQSMECTLQKQIPPKFHQFVGRETIFHEKKPVVKTQSKSTNKTFKNNSKKDTFLEIRKFVERISVFLFKE